MMLNGNVMASDIGTNKLRFASGIERRIAAGTAIYDALAHRIVNINASPTDKFKAYASGIARAAFKSGSRIASSENCRLQDYNPYRKIVR